MSDIVLYKRSNQSSPLSQDQIDENWVIIETAVNSKGSGTGTVTSVALALPNIFTVSGSPITTSGTLTAVLASQIANKFLAAPDGSNGTPTFRVIALGDLPTISIAKGGTNSTTALTGNKVMVSSGSAIVESSTIDTTELGYLDGVTSNIQTQLNSKQATISVLPLSKGGTGLNISSPAVKKILVGNGTGFALLTLTAGTNITLTQTGTTLTIDADTAPVTSVFGRTGTIDPLTGDYTTDQVTEGSNLYFTNGRVDTEIDSYVTASSPLSITGGAISIDQSDTSTDGYLSSTDWNTFNNKLGGSFNTVASGSLSFDYGVWYSSGNCSLPQITSGDISKTLFVKNISGSAITVSPYSGATIDGQSSITLSAGSKAQGGLLLQAYSTSSWYILSHTGTIS